LKKVNKNEILKIAINDKSKRVRIKAADVILRLQDNKKLKLLTERLVTETDKSVKDAIKFTLDNFNRIRKKDDGSTVLEIELKTTYNNGEHT
jgi:HEAT repeat protein